MASAKEKKAKKEKIDFDLAVHFHHFVIFRIDNGG
jgi:hypothetical protein